MSDREQDKRVAEILGWTFWSERRGEYLLHLVWPPKKDPPYRVSRDWEIQKNRYTQLDASEFKWGNCANASILPRYTTDPAADYKVLEWVREHLDETQYNAWVAEVALQNAALNKITEPTVFTVRVFLRDYQPGDYSRALLALNEQGLLK